MFRFVFDPFVAAFVVSLLLMVNSNELLCSSFVFEQMVQYSVVGI